MQTAEKKKQLELIIESLYRMEKKLSKCILTLKLERDTHVPDLMTRIRILEGVAVVAQKDKVARFFDGDAQLQISCKYLSKFDDIFESLKQICEDIKKLPGVKTVAVDSFDKNKITFKGKKVVF